MPPAWLSILADIALALSVLCALVVAVDVSAHPQKMAIMNFVWPITTLYLGIFGLWAYFALGRLGSKRNMGDVSAESAGRRQTGPSWRSVFIGVTHCGAGCALGDIIAERAMRSSGWTIAGDTFWASVAADFLLAYLLGIVFQYFSIAPMRGLGLGQGIVAAVKADTLSIVAYEAGMLAWMGLIHFVFFQPPLNSTMSAYWFMMQIAMVVGFAVSYPVNRWLVRKGFKEAM